MTLKSGDRVIHSCDDEESFKEWFGELMHERLKVIEDEFPYERLKKEFGLNFRESNFVKTYCSTFNAFKSALFAGYSKNTAGANAHKFFGSKKIINAKETILEVVLSCTQQQRITLMEKCVLKLSSIIDTGRDDSAIKAIDILHKFIADPPVVVKSSEKIEEVVTDKEIEENYKKFGLSECKETNS